MKVALIYPRFEKFLTNNPELDEGLTKYFLGDFTTPPSLGIPILASLTPDDVDLVFLDDNCGDHIDFSVKYDLVGINCFTPQATRAFEIADGFRANGTKVVMGGFFPSFMVDECLEHADAVSIGEGEPTWPTILEDAKHNRLKKIYKGRCKSDLGEWPIPKRDIFYNKKGYDWEEDLIQFSRGCSYNCAMCAIPAHMGYKMRFKPIDKVVEEVKTLKYENVYLADDSLFFPQRNVKEYATKLLQALTPLNKKYFVSSTVALNCDKDFMELAAKAGVKNFYCTMNVDPFSIKALQGDKKEQQRIIDLVKMLEDYDIRFFGSCALGRDWDDTSIADRILDLYDKANIETSEFFIFTPYPGSEHWKRMERQNRIIDKTWKHYNGAHVVFEPAKMSSDELYGQFIKVWNEFYRKIKQEKVSQLEPSTFENGIKIVGKPLQNQGVRGESVVTGMGVLSPIGNTLPEITDSILQAKSGIDILKDIDMSHFRLKYGGQIRDFIPSENFNNEELGIYTDRYIQYAIVSIKKAIKDAGLTLADLQNRDVGIILSTCNGGLLTGEGLYKWKHGKSDKEYTEEMNVQAQYYGFGKAIASYFKLKCQIWIVTTACSSSTGALGLAKTLIDREYCKTVIVGGSDSMPIANIAGFDALGATSSEKTAPFSTPEGLNIGEAACFWVVEEMEQAIIRKVKIHARIAGHATSLDAYHPTSPDPKGDGVYSTLNNSLISSEYPISDVGCINTHGTGTNSNDKCENRGIHKLIGEHEIPAVSLKSFFGHCMGTTGILEATCNILAMNSNVIPPTINFNGFREGCDIDCVPNEARKSDYDLFLSGNYAFGGSNAGVAISKWDKPIVKSEKSNNRVVITGTGIISSVGIGTESTIASLVEGKSGLKENPHVYQEGLPSKKAGFVDDFSSKEINRRLDFKKITNKISKYAVSAAALALAQAKLKPNRKNADTFGLSVGISNGPPEINHMDKVFSSDNYAADTTSFSNITANSIAGWVSCVLCLKGVNTTVATGPHAALQAVAWAYDKLVLGDSQHILAGGADEVDKQTFFNYNKIEYLYSGSDEDSYQYHSEEGKRKVLGEGSSMLLLETMDEAQKREVPILGEILGYAMNMDTAPMQEQCLNSDNLKEAVKTALTRSGKSTNDIDLIVWAPQGNRQDDKVLSVCKEKFSGTSIIGSTFTTGYVESCSITTTLASVLETVSKGEKLWQEKTGIHYIDTMNMPDSVHNILTIASTDLGYNYAMVVTTKIK